MPRPARTCSAPDCGRRHFARGYCKLHDARVKKNGSCTPPWENPVEQDDISWFVGILNDKRQVVGKARISEEDVPRVRCRGWRVLPASGGYVAARGKPAVLLHRYILDAERDEEVDHRNGDVLDNRRENLRRVSHALNMENTRVHERSTTGYRNVYTFRDGFRVQATKRGKAYFGGLYARLEDAVEAAQRLRDALYTHHVEERCRKG